MAPTKRTFTTRMQQGLEAIEFDLEGQYLHPKDGEAPQWHEHFLCLPLAPGQATLDVAGAAHTDNRGNRIYSAAAVTSFLLQVVDPGDEQRLMELLTDKGRLVDIETLGEVMLWLAEVYADRPTGPSSN